MIKKGLNLVEETLAHFAEGAKSVRAHNDDVTYIITPAVHGEFTIQEEGPLFEKKKVESLEPFFENIFGIEARY
jgi:hypothetical protein